MSLESPSFLPDRAYYRELLRPWKLTTFAIAMSWLLYGALTFEIGDWDVGVTLIMGGLTYLLAPWSVQLIITAVLERPRYASLHVIFAFVLAVFVVDWAYMGYHMLLDNPIYRDANFYASMPLFFMAGFVWLYRGPLSQMRQNIRTLIGSTGKND